MRPGSSSNSSSACSSGSCCGKVDLLFTPTFLNHMVNELEEYEQLLEELLAGRPVQQ